MTTASTSEVLAVLAALPEAWNAGDAAAYGRLFTEDADYITFFGMNMPGRQAIEDGHRALFEGPLSGMKLVEAGSPPRVRFLREDVAVVVAGGGSALDGRGVPGPGRESMLTYVLVRESGGWLIASFHNTRVSDPRAA
ncbi:SgcJ/EcaC family oxidoreductase [Amycolatopsis sp. H20-H5]|uniref:SgcJ/EcaC family oxidoreductase n=1 Tax=Amycolatopsis sp. H20-H5 TaxID=3046309 RepID=UPI002DBFCA15|nr:SgcJ/EcaC family oxidoreductase [Amycolatopsis sp. H20-H5]MEC3977237.1 SgcJ/EcaC family oxidoreductase [Amycolatopsis sp. H20-H5]